MADDADMSADVVDGALDSADETLDDAASVASSTPTMMEPMEEDSHVGRCGCNELYDEGRHAPLSAECGHTQCQSCWDANNCGTCSKVPEDLQPAFPGTARDLLSPVCLETPSISRHGSAHGSISSSMESLNSDKMQTPVQIQASEVVTASPECEMEQPHNAMGPAISESFNCSQNGEALNGRQPATSQRSKPQTDPNTSSILVKCINGKEVRKVLNTATTTVLQLKAIVEQETNISIQRQILLHKGKTMTDTATLKAFNVQNGSVIQMGMANNGG